MKGIFTSIVILITMILSLTAAQAQETYLIGDIVELEEYHIVVLGWRQFEGTKTVKPKSGQRFVTVDVVMYNPTNKSYTNYSHQDAELKDQNNWKYKPDIKSSFASREEFPDKIILPGEVVRGTVSFQIPKEKSELIFVWPIDEGKIFFELGRKPTMIDAPNEIIEKSNVKIGRVGETIETKHIRLKVNEVSFSKGKGKFKPDKGMQYMIVDVEIENIAGSSFHIQSEAQCFLKASDGKKKRMSPNGTRLMGRRVIEGEIAPNEKVRGLLGYHVPKEMNEAVWLFIHPDEDDKILVQVL